MFVNAKNYMKRYAFANKAWKWWKGFLIDFNNFKTNSTITMIRIKDRIQNGLPLPPPDLMTLVAGSTDLRWFLDSGRLGATSLIAILKKNNLCMEDFHSILDFGCGVGRVLRYWKKIQGPEFNGADYNSILVNWCKENLPFVNFTTNPLCGSLDYEDGKFDFIYVLSVFTHLREPEQLFWMDELTRVLKPGGYLFITVHGEKFYLPQLQPEEQMHFRNGELVVRNGDQEGTNTCAAFHPEKYVRERMAKHMIVVDYIPEGALGNPKQDVFLLRKPLTGKA